MKIIPIASGSKGNCFIIDDGQTKIVLDFGIPYKMIQKALDYNITSVAGFLLSHEHL